METLSNSLTEVNSGFLSITTQQFGETEISQFVNAYNASIVTLGEIPFIRLIIISTSCAVLSSIFLILIFPLLLAFIIESIKFEEVIL